MRKALYILGELEDADIEWMIRAGRRRAVPRGTVLIEEGRPLDSLFLVLDGELAVTAKALGGQVLARLLSGEILGEMSFVDAAPPSATVTAQQDAVVLAMPRAGLHAQMAADTGFGMRFYRALSIFLSDRMRSTVKRLGYGGGDGEDLDESVQYDDELDENVLDNIHLASARFEHILQRVQTAARE